ncbi:MAG: hypothetical protein IT357_09540 [Gemmatimonadaceae bacterium]|nr:hypothetical protein [Gemmatimonadaceae bacterium]
MSRALMLVEERRSTLADTWELGSARTKTLGDRCASAESLDFLSYVIYAQLAGRSTPGPVAGFP